ncbi:PH domain-containing protein [Thermaerobacillus caldiproteolyticus]|uniref:Putative membrane protein n=1 Tax=Thermaerobacillus caldiproteolyticus TaxID=247480 RepID=A0A7W0C059_9BACL|nr:PH domain-containing protein [Anoxybacillus caldiproteolyticus]MBA2876355.1 putative membrane protein [Anoxybacillus caldiproteolyticus]
MNKPRRLHPIASLIYFIKMVREWIIPFVVVLVFGKNNHPSFLGLKWVGVSIVLLMSLIVGIASWYRFTYRIEQGELRIEYGVFVRKRRYIPQENIQAIHISSGIVQRLFGLVKLQIETAGGNQEAEAVLTAITREEAERLRVLLLQDEFSVEKESTEALLCYKAAYKDLLIAASTSGRLGIVLSAIGALFSQFDEWIPYEAIFRKLRQFVHLDAVLLIVAAVVVVTLAWFISILIIVVKYRHFTVQRKGKDIIISHGWLEKRQFTIPLAHIQAIRISQNPVRELFGYAAVYIESAGSTFEKDANYSTMLFPLVNMKDINERLETFVPGYTIPFSFISLPRRALPRYLRRVMLFPAICIFIICYFFRPWGYALLLALLPLVWLGYARYKDGGWNIAGCQLALRYRLVTKIIVLLEKQRIQSLERKQSIFQQQKKLATVGVSIRSGLHSKRFSVIDMSENDLCRIEDWYRPSGDIDED